MDRFTTRSGRELVLRGMSGDDRDREAAFVRGLSDQSRRRRFLSSLKELSPHLLDRLTRPDPEQETVIVAVDPSTDAFAGVARFAIDAETRCGEFAIVIGDDWRREGLGRHLMQRLADDARRRGLGSLVGLVLADNTDMRRLVRSLGFTLRPDPDDGSLSIATLSLDDAPADGS